MIFFFKHDYFIFNFNPLYQSECSMKVGSSKATVVEITDILVQLCILQLLYFIVELGIS